MKWRALLAATLVVCGLATQAFARQPAEAPADVKAIDQPQRPAAPNGPGLAQFQRTLTAWPFAYTGRSNPPHFGGYHPDHVSFCKTCYGGGGCGKDFTCQRCGACPGDTCDRNKIETCRKCGFFGRILFYECKRLGCEEKGGEGCKKGCPITVCNCKRCRIVRPQGFARWLTGEGERVFWIGNNPDYTLRFGCYGWSKNGEGPRNWYGLCCGCYETYLYGHFDARGPLNYDPTATSDCAEEDSIPYDGQQIKVGPVEPLIEAVPTDAPPALNLEQTSFRKVRK